MKKRIVSILTMLAITLSLCTWAVGTAAESSLLTGFTKATTTSQKNAATTAKNALNNIIPYYRAYYAKVTIDENKQLPSVIAYKNELDILEALLATSTLYLSRYYETEGSGNVEELWQTFRAELPISTGLIAMREAMKAAVGDSSKYDAAAWASYQATLPSVDQMTDNLKNSLTATDVDGLNALAVLQQVIDNLENPSTQTPEDIAAKEELANSLEAYRALLSRDTKATKSPETTTMASMISAASTLVASNTATAADYKKALADLDSYCNNVFMPALFIGQPFINAAREIYYAAARQWRTYSETSWNAVSNAINHCDEVKPSGTDAQCAAAYSALKTAIANLKPRTANTAVLNVSSGGVKPGESFTSTVSVGAGSGMIYGNFTLYFDSAVLEAVEVSDQHAEICDGAVTYTYENPIPLTTQSNILTITFKAKQYAEGGNFPLTLVTDRLRDNGGYLITPQITNGNVTLSSPYVRGNVTQTGEVSTSDARNILLDALGDGSLDEAEKALADYNMDGEISTTDARKALRASVGLEDIFSVKYDTQGSQDTIASASGAKATLKELATTVPAKSGYVFRGWYTQPDGQGIKADSCAIFSKDRTLFAYYEPFAAGALTKDQIKFGGYVAIHNAYAVEDDFKMLAKSGTTIIILDYDRANKAQSDKCIAWAEKYGIKAYIHDYDLLSLSSFTTAKVLQYTADYRQSPCFAGGNLVDEPSNTQFAALQAKAAVYKKALPGYDMHINLFPDYGVTSLIGISFQSYINQYISTVTSCDHISQDPYPFANANGTKAVGSTYYTGIQTMAVAARDNNLDYWIYPQLLTGMNNYFPDLDDIRFQIYSGLAFGASKFMQYCYHVPGYNGITYSAEVYAMRDYAGAYTELWDYAQYVQNEVSTFADVYSQYQWKVAGAYKTGTVPSYLSPITAFSSTALTNLSSNQCLVIGDFTQKTGSGKAFMITNASDLNKNAAATVSFSAPNASTVTAYIDGGCELLTPVAGKYTISLKTAQGAFITLQ